MLSYKTDEFGAKHVVAMMRLLQKACEMRTDPTWFEAAFVHILEKYSYSNISLSHSPTQSLNIFQRQSR